MPVYTILLVMHQNNYIIDERLTTIIQLYRRYYIQSGSAVCLQTVDVHIYIMPSLGTRTAPSDHHFLHSV